MDFTNFTNEIFNCSINLIVPTIKSDWLHSSWRNVDTWVIPLHRSNRGRAPDKRKKNTVNQRKNEKHCGRFTAIKMKVNHLQKWEWLIELCDVGSFFSFFALSLSLLISFFLSHCLVTSQAATAADVSHFRHDSYIDSLRWFISGLLNVTWSCSPVQFAIENECLVIDLISVIIIITIHLLQLLSKPNLFYCR